MLPGIRLVKSHVKVTIQLITELVPYSRQDSGNPVKLLKEETHAISRLHHVALTNHFVSMGR